MNSGKYNPSFLSYKSAITQGLLPLFFMLAEASYTCEEMIIPRYFADQMQFRPAVIANVAAEWQLQWWVMCLWYVSVFRFSAFMRP